MTELMEMGEYIVNLTPKLYTILRFRRGEEIVRCRDCKWLRVDMSDHEYRSGYWCDMGRFDPKPDGFCAWGERQEP